MKIIGQIDRYTYIAQVSGRELDAVIGKPESPYPHDYRVGEQINICATWRKLRHILELRRDFDSVTKTLSAVNDLLDHVGKDILEKIASAGEEAKP